MILVERNCIKLEFTLKTNRLAKDHYFFQMKKIFLTAKKFIPRMMMEMKDGLAQYL